MDERVGADVYGDSFSVTIWETLMDKNVQCIFTSPPFELIDALLAMVYSLDWLWASLEGLCVHTFGGLSVQRS